MRINAGMCRRRNILTLVGDLDWGPSEQAARLPRGYRAASFREERFLLGSAGLFDPELAPTLWAYLAVDQCAGIRLLEQRAVAALLIAFRRVLVCQRRLAHFGGRLPRGQQYSSGPRCAACAVQKNGAPGQCA